MPHRPMTPAEKKAQSRRMKARWRKAKETQAAITLNGSLVEQRIVLHLSGQTLDLPITDAKALRDALDLIVPKAE